MKKSGNVTRGQSIRPVSEIGEKPPNPTSGKRRRKTKRPSKTSVYPEDLAPKDALNNDGKNLLALRRKNREWMAGDSMLRSDLNGEKG